MPSIQKPTLVPAASVVAPAPVTPVTAPVAAPVTTPVTAPVTTAQDQFEPSKTGAGKFESSRTDAGKDAGKSAWGQATTSKQPAQSPLAVRIAQATHTQASTQVVKEAPKPIDVAAYQSIIDEHKTADWIDCGIEPKKYVADRFDMQKFIAPLLQNSQASVTIHRGAQKVGHLLENTNLDAGLVKNMTNVSLADAKDFPASVYQDRQGNFHVLGLYGEDWYRQALHMFAVAGVPASQIKSTGQADASAMIKSDLDPTLQTHRFDSVVLCSIGEMTRAVERTLRAQMQPQHAVQIAGEMRTYLQQQINDARPDKKARWQTRLDAFDALSRQQPALTAEQLMLAVQQDAGLAGPLGELLKKYNDGMPKEKLPWVCQNGKAQLINHRILEVEGKKHLLIHVGSAHGDLAEQALSHVLASQKHITRVGMYGSAGSLRDTIPPDTLIVPQSQIKSVEPDRSEISVKNQIDEATLQKLAGTSVKTVAHSNVSTLLKEHRAGLDAMLQLPADSVDIESYHAAKAVAAHTTASRPIEWRVVLRVSDVATTSHLGAHRADRANTSNYTGRRSAEESVAALLGILPMPNLPASLVGM